MSVAERREARKRRILENLDNRLQKITGISNKLENVGQTFKDETQFVTSTPLVYDKREEGILNDQENLEISSSYPFKSNPNVASMPENTAFQKILFNIELQIIFLAVLAYSLLRYKAGFLIYESLMVPFYSLEIIHVGFRQNDGSSNIASVLITVLGMYGISNTFVKVATKVIMLAYSLGKDLCLYLFVIILTSKLLG